MIMATPSTLPLKGCRATPRTERERGCPFVTQRAERWRARDAAEVLIRAGGDLDHALSAATVTPRRSAMSRPTPEPGTVRGARHNASPRTDG
jgi:hypothetical protein